MKPEMKMEAVGLYLVGAGDMKINAIREVRRIAGLDLKQAKEIVDNCGPDNPRLLTEHFTRQDIEVFKSIGCTVQLRALVPQVPQTLGVYQARGVALFVAVMSVHAPDLTYELKFGPLGMQAYIEMPSGRWSGEVATLFVARPI
jgi:hypothetical protein